MKKLLPVYIDAFCSIGKFHQIDGAPFEDYFAISETKEALTVVVSDGMGSKKASDELSKMISVNLAREIQRCWTSSSYFSDYSFVRGFVCRSIQSTYEEFCADREILPDENDYGCTLIVCHVNKQTGNGVSIHIGDGGILSVPYGGDAEEWLSPPANNDLGHTYNAISEVGQEHLRVHFFNVSSMKSLFLGSDGGLRLFREGDINNLYTHIENGYRLRNLREQYSYAGADHDDMTLIAVVFDELDFASINEESSFYTVDDYMNRENRWVAETDAESSVKLVRRHHFNDDANAITQEKRGSCRSARSLCVLKTSLISLLVTVCIGTGMILGYQCMDALKDHEVRLDRLEEKFNMKLEKTTHFKIDEDLILIE